MKHLLIIGAIIGICSIFIPDTHQGLKQQSYPNPPHTSFNHVTKNYFPLGKWISEKYGSVEGPETLAMLKNGDMFAGVKNGGIIHIDAFSGNISDVATVPGRALGLALTSSEDGLYVCVAAVGLVFVDLLTKDVIILSTISDDGIPIRFADDVSVASDGKVYFSDASRISPWIDEHGDSNPMMASLMDAALGSGTGRLLVYDPSDKTTRTLMGDLLFANGVAIAPDESFVLVCETFGFRITRFWLSGYRKDTIDYLVTALPGFPDNLRPSATGGYWVAINAEATPLFDILVGLPLLRYFLSYIRLSLIPTKHIGAILKLNENGIISHSLVDAEATATSSLTCVVEYGSGLFLGSLYNNFVGYIDLVDIGLLVAPNASNTGHNDLLS